MAGEDRDIGRGGAVMLLSAMTLLAATYLASGGLPHGVAAGLLCGMAGIGAARLAIGVYYARRGAAGSTPGPVPEWVGQHAEPDGSHGSPRNAFEGNYRILGLDMDADLRSLRRAYRERRALYLRNFTPAGRFQLAEIEAAYRYLRRVLAPHGAPAHPHRDGGLPGSARLSR